MDACYGGLAITRTLQPGSMRFLKDMLLRPSRQVISAGKANEVVADSGGPLPNHSIFSGHLLEALSGKAKDNEDCLTANGLMNYVYRNVANDPDSKQTPHFGYLSGDGDFIFSAPILSELEKGAEKDTDILLTIPIADIANQEGISMDLSSKVKQYLSQAENRIKRHDLAILETRQAIGLIDEDRFPAGTAWSPDEFLQRLKKYEEALANLTTIQMLLGYWATQNHKNTLVTPIKRIIPNTRGNGLTIWLEMRRYPLFLLLFAGGLGAVAGGNYENLYTIVHAPTTEEHQRSKTIPVLLSLYNFYTKTFDGFKQIPGHERNFVPRSE